jgi:hypothetical protein
VDSVTDFVAHVGGVDLAELLPLTVLVIRTRNSEYRVVVIEGSSVCVQGGAFFAEPMWAEVIAASVGGSVRKFGWIAVGLRMELEVAGIRVLTSPVVAITMQRPAITVVD